MSTRQIGRISNSSKKQGFWANIFIIGLIVGIFLGISISIIYEAVIVRGYGLFSGDFFNYIPEWFQDHSFVAITGGIIIIFGLLVGLRYGAGMRMTAVVLGPWGTMTSVFFVSIAMFLIARLDDSTLKEMMLNPLDSFVVGTILFGIGTGGILWWIIRVIITDKPGERKDPVFYLIFLGFFASITLLGFLSGAFAAASVKFANLVQPIYEPEKANPALALFTFFFTPIAGLYAIGFFLPMVIMPIFLFIFSDVGGTRNVKELVGVSKESRFFIGGAKVKAKRHVKLKKREFKRKGGRK